MYDPHGWQSGPGPTDPSTSALWADPEPVFPQGSIPRQPLPPLSPLDPYWDPAEELAYLLQDSLMRAPERPAAPPAPPDPPDTAPTVDDSLEDPSRTTVELPALHRPRRSGHRRTPSRKPAMKPLQTISFLIAAVAAVIVSMVSVFGGMVTYDPLRHIAAPRTAADAVAWWPLLVYGPWLVASLSVLRAALHQRRAVHSWSVVLLFSAVSVLLCVAQAPGTHLDAAIAALPSIAALACFQQLIRQITLTRPPRQPTPRHRTSASPTAASGRKKQSRTQPK
ncbi:DUF2637 domain-containing protein [Streptomyces sp. NPDC004838]